MEIQVAPIPANSALFCHIMCQIRQNYARYGRFERVVDSLRNLALKKLLPHILLHNNFSAKVLM